ncbi:Na/Pi cotransporter family protein [bacterium]|nr:Na/Pi cotransporter family protein [bacterium]
MDIYSLITLIGGLAFFLYGISIMSSGLEKVAGGRLEKLLKKMTSNPLKSFVLGAGITAVIQSSSAVTVMLIGLVNSGIMQLSQTVSVIIGANLGTTITAWLLSLTGIQESAGSILKMLKPETFAPILAFIGIIMIMRSKSNKRKSVGSVLIGFAILMYGMELMAGAMSPLASMPEFQNLMIAFKNPFLGFMVGLILTAIIQSSSASIGILQALSIGGGVSWGVAIPIILGQNLGTCISAILASIGVSTNAKRVAGIHIVYNILSVGICLPLFIILNLIFRFKFLSTSISPFGIAVFHTIYNVFTALMLFPFIKLIEKLTIKFIPDKQTESEKVVFLDDRLLLSPSLAISECFRKTIDMAELVHYNYISSSKMLKSYHHKKADQINENETTIDKYEDKLGAFLLKLSGKDLNEEDSNKISHILLAIGDIERMGDHCVHILKVAEKLKDMEKKLSPEAIEELKIIVNAVSEIFDMSFQAYKNDDMELAQKVEPLEAVIKKGVRRAKNNHIQRLKDGQCCAEVSFLFSDLLNDFRRIAAHAGNIATSVIQLYDTTLDKHEYNHRNKDEDLEFKTRYKDYKSRYRVEKKITEDSAVQPQ